jgi:hypothetical protein
MSANDRRYLHTLTAGAWLPVIQSLITGVIVALVVLVIAYQVRGRSPWTWSLVIGCLSMVGCWFALAGHWYRLTDLESLTGLDLNRDGRIGEIDSSLLSHNRRDEVRVYVSEITSNGHVTGNQNILNFPCSSNQLVQLSEGLLAGVPLAERSWTGSGQPFSITGFRAVRSEMIKRGLVSLASSKDSRQGYVLTLAGRHILAGVLDELTPPLPS